MRCAATSALCCLLAVVCGALVGASDAMVNVSHVSRTRRAPLPHHGHRVMDDELDAAAMWKRTHWKEMQSIMRHDGGGNKDVECCPSVLEMVAKKGGRTAQGLYVELYEDGENKQRLYELSCAPDVVDKPCRFVDARLYNQSKCVQRYSFSYALVRSTEPTESPQSRLRKAGQFSVPGTGGWSMDYVLVRAGCECQITPPKRRRAHQKRPPLERHRSRKKNRRLEEELEP